MVLLRRASPRVRMARGLGLGVIDATGANRNGAFRNYSGANGLSIERRRANGRKALRAATLAARSAKLLGSGTAAAAVTLNWVKLLLKKTPGVELAAYKKLRGIRVVWFHLISKSLVPLKI